MWDLLLLDQYDLIQNKISLVIHWHTTQCICKIRIEWLVTWQLSHLSYSYYFPLKHNDSHLVECSLSSIEFTVLVYSAIYRLWIFVFYKYNCNRFPCFVNDHFENQISDPNLHLHFALMSTINLPVNGKEKSIFSIILLFIIICPNKNSIFCVNNSTGFSVFYEKSKQNSNYVFFKLNIIQKNALLCCDNVYRIILHIIKF